MLYKDKYESALKHRSPEQLNNANEISQRNERFMNQSKRMLVLKTTKCKI